ncbi:GNAT family N-acetyltransferase [Rhodocista pekingensis]|uniref:GNAT family N-acetyltransferase n=1 Tax=Rhodocista pekingensis TaxID=201185 RepID=A0ABW2KWC9_9PROT
MTTSGPAGDAGIVYAVEADLAPTEFVDVLRRSGLAERRPVDDPARIAAMLRHAGLTVTARAPDGRLVGVARSVTDFSFCCYLSDLAVDRDWQGHGIGRALMRRTRDEAVRLLDPAAGGPPLRCLLLAAPKARSYYPHLGLAALDNAFDFTDL